MILLRHGQSEFNLHYTATRRDPGIIDPELTPLGWQQAEAAAAALAQEPIRRIIASPYTRALQTAAPIARILGLAVEIHPLVRERSAFVCDIGSPRSVLTTAWPGHDFSAIEETWWQEGFEPAEIVEDRAARFRAEMRSRADWPHILLVSHWGFILALSGERLLNGAWMRFDPHVAPPPPVWG